MNVIAQKLIKLRKDKGLTQEELAEKAKINLRTIQRIENAENEPRGQTLNLICKALEIDSKVLIGQKNSYANKSIGTILVNGFFLLSLNLVLMGIVGFLTLDSNANVNSMLGGLLISFLLPLFIVILTKRMSRIERLLKFGFGYIAYFILIMIFHGFPVGFSTGLFPCLLVSVSVLYFGNDLVSLRKVKEFYN